MDKKPALFRLSFVGALGIAALFPAIVAAQSAAAPAQGAATPAAQGEDIGEVVVTGFRASLQSSVAEKRDNISITDSIFAEDIGKFPDLNLAESLQRIPGVQIARDFTGEGTSVAIRGLGRDFTQITLNGTPVETASDSTIDSVSQGRGIDLVLFPTELFHQLTVSKTPTASQVEGAVAANVDLRVARPFDNKGFHINYSAKANYQDSAEEWSPRLGLYASNTWEVGSGEFGVLAGVAYSDRKYRSDGYNNIGSTTVNVPGCPVTQPGCNSHAIPGVNPTVAANPTAGYGNTTQTWANTIPTGGQYDALLTPYLYDNDNNVATPQVLRLCGAGDTPGGTSGLSCNKLSYSIWPRLARPDILIGDRETTSGILSMQWAPSESLEFYLDGLYSKANHAYERNDLNLAVRNVNNNIPMDVTVDADNRVTHATLLNPQWLNENRPYVEDTTFLNTNLGTKWQMGEKFTLNASLNYNHSDWFRSTNTYLFNSRLNSGISVDLEATGDGAFHIEPSRDLNDLNFWTWNALRIQPVQREVYQKGGRFDVEWAFNDAFKLKGGYSRDEFHRTITNWETTSCATDGVNVSASLARTECANALAAAGVQNAKVAVPDATLNQYMQPWTHGELYRTADFNVGFQNGWALPNYRALDPAVNIKYFEQDLAVGLAGGINVAGYNPRVLDEDTDGMFLEANGKLEILGGLRYNLGARYISTDQFISGYISANTPAGPARQYLANTSDYDKVLPSLNIASDLGHGLVLRAAASKTMTRAQPGDIAPNQTLSVSGDVLTIGNPDLAPYFSKNYDLGLEWYFSDSGLGMVALNAWQKKIEGYTTVIGTPTPFGDLGLDYATLPIATQTGLLTTATNQCQCGAAADYNDALVRVDQRQNTNELITLNGWEFTYVQPLDMMLQGAGFTMNYTHINQKSEGGLPGQPSSAVYGLSPYTYNVTAYYENFGFSGRMTWSVRDSFIEQFPVNENNMPGDNLGQKRGYLDASFSYKLPMETDISISLELQNLTNEQLLTYYQDSPLMPRASFAPGRQALLGISGKF
jgi:TonB-dependent receptor